jgi:molybdopterin converting factor small subunit
VSGNSLITVSVRYHNVLRQIAGRERETVTLATGTLHALLEQLAEAHGPALQTLLFGADGQVSAHLVVFRNQQLVPRAQSQLVLADGDDLMLFPAVSGG